MSQESQRIVSHSKNKTWYNHNGLQHRIDGPAVEWNNGAKEWWFNGLRHRSDGPTIEWTDGHKEWWLNGKRHRIDGPAVEVADGTKEWYFNDEWLGLGDEGFWALWELLNDEQRSDWKLLQHAPWVKS